LSCIVSFVSSCGLVFASEFLTIAYRLVFVSRIVQSSFRVSSSLRFAYRSVFVSRIVQSSFRVSSGLRFAYRLFFVSRNKLLKSSCIALILQFTICGRALSGFGDPKGYPVVANKIYKQTFGILMGFPLSPITADLTIRDLEKNVLNALNIRPVLYYRYVDDILLSVSKEEIHIILNKFNNYHHRLKFTLEIEVNRCLSFLDITLKIKNNRIIIDWFHKITFSGQYLSFYSNHPTSHKIGIIQGDSE